MAKTLVINTMAKASACFQNTLATIENKYATTKEYITNKYTTIRQRMDTVAIENKLRDIKNKIFNMRNIEL